MQTLNAVMAFLVAGMVSAEPPANMINRQSQNEGLAVLPTPGAVSIDGDLSDWDWSGRIWCFADSNVRSRYSVEAAAMWDTDFLYLAAKWKDPSPMFSAVNPEFNREEGWKSDSWQLRVLTDQISHFTTWYYAEKKMPTMHVTHAPRGSGDPQFIVCKENGTQLGQGIEVAYRMDADGKGYAQELRIPWSVLYKSVPAIEAGLVFRLGNEFLWGDPTGKTWPIHRYADNMQPGVTSREFYWTNTKAWGNAELKAAGNVAVRQYVSAEARLAGTIPVRVTIPEQAARFTVAINDEAGQRVRNLAADFVPEDYSVAVKDGNRTVEVLWDGLNDAGKLVQPGTYRAVGLTHAGLGAEFDMCFYNPGTPPWSTTSGAGAWGADHTGPTAVATAGDWMILGCHGVEGGSGIWGVAPDGTKKWGEKRGALVLAADETHVYVIANSWYVSGALCRFDKATGANRPFILDGKPRPFELTLKDLFGSRAPAAEGQPAAWTPFAGEIKASVSALAANGKELLLARQDGKLFVLDATSAEVKNSFDIVGITALALTPAGTAFAVQDGKLVGIDLTTGAVSAIPAAGLGKAIGIAMDAEGNLVTADLGPDCQVKAFTPAGKLAYACGKKGGRARRGYWDAQAMRQMSSVAVDSQGNIWVTEHCESPRRVSVWGRDGKLVRDYIGNTGYSGTGAYLHESDPDLVYVGPVEMKLDRITRTYAVTRVLWVPDEAIGEAFPIQRRTGHWFSNGSFIRSAYSGKDQRYLFFNDSYNAVYMERGTSWQPVAVLGHIRNLPPFLRQGAFQDCDEKDGFYWNDLNQDGKVDRDECVIVKGGIPLGRSSTDWGKRLGQDLSIFANGLVRYKPIRFAADGAPIYGPEGLSKLAVHEEGDLIPLTEENFLFCMSFKGYPGATTGMLGIDLGSEKILWSYPNPYPSVHGSHNATMPKPGLLIGAIKLCGVAKVNDAIGNVCLVRGNLGQDFLFTTDGLYVGALFQDGRLPADTLPDTEAALRGMPMEGFTEGGEPFNGWFGKHADGKIRLTTGMAREAGMILEIKGLETIARWSPLELRVDSATLAKAEQDNAARLAAASGAKSYKLRKVSAAPAFNSGDAWAPALPIEVEGSPNKGTLRMGYDDGNLHLLFAVEDASPWKNEGKDHTRLFKTGDAVDLQLGTGTKRKDVAAGDLRLVFAPYQGKPAVVLMKPIDPGAPAELKVQHTSPVGSRMFDRVQILEAAKIEVKVESARYWVKASVPLAALGLKPQAGQVLRGDAGIISSDAAGLVNMARTYWSNKATNLVNDLPQEAWLYPETWGEFVFE